ncbi:MAG: alpha/beta fold hydrolase [Gammaproteobacteria bacterium]
MRPTVLFIHGGGGGGWEWARWLPCFRVAGFSTRAPTLQPSAAGLTHTRFEDYLDQLQATAVRCDQPILIGASLGGLLALKLAEHVPASAIVLVNSLPPVGTRGWQPQKHYPARVAWSRKTRLEDTRAAMPEADEDTVWWAHARWRDESGAVLNTAYAGVSVTPPSCPVLILNGERDRTVPWKIGETMARDLNAEFIRLPGASHLGPLLGPQAQAVARTALEWLHARLTA